MSFDEKVREALKASQYWTNKTRLSNNTIQGLSCPACGDKNAWAYASSPMAINCNRMSQCGARTKTLELFPEIRQDIERDFPATKEDPHRPAREYLKSRGLSRVLPGLNFRYLRDARKTGSGAVMFLVTTGPDGKDILNGRLFNPPPGDGKTHNIGSTAGRYWQHPAMTYDPNQKTFITEGILDALSLLEMGKQAIAVLASGQDPARVDLSFFQNLALAFDNDEAGHRACKKWKATHPAAEVILCDQGQDWNDILNTGPIAKVKEQFEQDLPRYRHNGALALAANANDFATIYHQFYTYPPGLFTFNRSTYFSTLKTPRNEAESPFVAVSICIRGTIKVLSYIMDRSTPAKPEYLYNLEVHPAKGRPVEVIATGKDISSARALNEFLLSTAKINWEGDAKAATALQTKITSDKAAPEVVQLAVTGYQPESGHYIFNRWAVDISGNLAAPNKRSVFKIGHNQYFKPPQHGESKSIQAIAITKKRAKEIYRLIHEAWGLNGVVALSWTVAGWFVNQVKAETNFFPFLSLFGDPASGKSALVTLLNNIQGREGEGLPVTQLNTKKGAIRTIGQVSGLFTALLEDNDRNEKGFDYSIILTAYNRGPLQVQASFSNDLATKENPFLGTLLFSQNLEPFNSKAEKQRTISLEFKAEGISDSTRAAYEKLTAIDKREIAGIMQQVLIKRAHFKDWHKEYTAAQTTLRPMAERRILDNHALILAFYRLFCTCFDIDIEPPVIAFMAKIGRKKCVTSAIRRTTVADHFFELLDSIDTERYPTACHYNLERKLVLVNLPEVERVLRNRGLNFQISELLTRALQEHPSYLRNSLKYRFPGTPELDLSGRPIQKKSWVFDLEWFIKNSNLELIDNKEEGANP
ncbi:MAG: toprim domain-containing protein [Desulfobulbus sp.]